MRQSALSAFKYNTFAVMWLAALVSNIGTWMHSVGAAWLMVDLSASPLVISLVQTVTTLPIFLFALPAGTLADIFNRRTILLIANVSMFVVAIVFAVLVWHDMVSSATLLFFTFLLGVGVAFMAPAWQAVIPQMVPRGQLPQAVALGGISINLSRAIGPALAGILISVYGIESPFIANAASFTLIIVALLWWKNLPSPSNADLPSERVCSAMVAGMRYACNSSPLKATMWHVLGFMFFANAYWGLLPIIAKDNLGGGATFFGILTGAVGLGAVLGALLLPYLKTRLHANQLVMIGTLGTAMITGYFAIVQFQAIAIIASLIFGISWILVLVSINVSAQQALPQWVRARGLAIFMMVFFGGISLGAAFWGWLAGIASVKVSMIVAAIGGLIFALFSYRFKLQQGESLNFCPSHHWPQPLVHDAIEDFGGSVIIQIHYIIADEDRRDFLQALYKLKPARQRGGAYSWGVYEDAELKGHFVEHFKQASWVEHLRHHERVTQTDKQLQIAVQAFHQGQEKPKVGHFIATYPIKRVAS
jgi:MFS family permease